MKKHFKDQFLYTNWANERVLSLLEDKQIRDEKILDLFSHTISAQIIWLLRIQGLPTSPFPVWERYNLKELRSMHDQSSANWIKYLDGHKLDTFEEMIFYTNAKGAKFEATIREIMSQVIAHGAYHRGQIALKLREMGIDPIPTDYIVYQRLK